MELDFTLQHPQRTRELNQKEAHTLSDVQSFSVTPQAKRY
jgi:hypothetical protein